jgi:hypothetical protein
MPKKIQYAVKGVVLQRELKPARQRVAPAGSNQSGDGGNEAAGVFGEEDHYVIWRTGRP